MMLTAYGKVLSVLTSKSLQALTAVCTIGQSVGSIRLWRRHHEEDVLARISARDALNLVTEFGGDPTRLMQRARPDLEIEIQPAADDTELFVHPELPLDIDPPYPPGQAEVTMVDKSGEAIVRGRRITVIRNYPDGRQEVIQANG
jgi:hypothetical protein